MESTETKINIIIQAVVKQALRIYSSKSVEQPVMQDIAMEYKLVILDTIVVAKFTSMLSWLAISIAPGTMSIVVILNLHPKQFLAYLESVTIPMGIAKEFIVDPTGTKFLELKDSNSSQVHIKEPQVATNKPLELQLVIVDYHS